jgi:hypothetical protein
MADFKEIRANEFQSPQIADAHRVKATEQGIQFEFAKFGENDELTVISSIIMNPKIFLEFILRGYGACIDSQKEYKVDLGLEIPDEVSEKEE